MKLYSIEIINILLKYRNNDAHGITLQITVFIDTFRSYDFAHGIIVIAIELASDWRRERTCVSMRICTRHH